MTTICLLPPDECFWLGRVFPKWAKSYIITRYNLWYFRPSGVSDPASAVLLMCGVVDLDTKVFVISNRFILSVMITFFTCIYIAFDVILSVSLNAGLILGMNSRCIYLSWKVKEIAIKWPWNYLQDNCQISQKWRTIHIKTPNP